MNRILLWLRSIFYLRCENCQRKVSDATSGNGNLLLKKEKIMLWEGAKVDWHDASVEKPIPTERCQRYLIVIRWKCRESNTTYINRATGERHGGGIAKIHVFHRMEVAMWLEDQKIWIDAMDRDIDDQTSVRMWAELPFFPTDMPDTERDKKLDQYAEKYGAPV